MVETCSQLLGRPISLDLYDHPHAVFIQALISLSSTVLSTEPLGDLAPSPAHLAGLVAADHHRRRSAQPTCRRPVTPPKHLW
jgi:hypothetical protein